MVELSQEWQGAWLFSIPLDGIIREKFTSPHTDLQLAFVKQGVQALLCDKLYLYYVVTHKAVSA